MGYREIFINNQIPEAQRDEAKRIFSEFDNSDNLQTRHESETDFDRLYLLKKYYEFNELNSRWTIKYIEIAAKLKSLALENKTTDKNQESVYYDWLKICLNPDNDPDIEFYFNCNQIDREEQVREILFANGCKLRDIFLTAAWQIRLRRIMKWFLKRYDIHTAYKIYRELKPSSYFEFVDISLPRLWGSIAVGFLPLIPATEIWGYPLHTSKYCLIAFPILSIILSYLYLKFEHFKATGEKNSEKPGVVFLLSLCYTAIMSFAVVLVFPKVLQINNSEMFKGSNPFFQFDNGNFMFFWQIWLFYASAALLIGILLQVFWEEKTITEPL